MATRHGQKVQEADQELLLISEMGLPVMHQEIFISPDNLKEMLILVPFHLSTMVNTIFL